jgi:hypothetical protein
MQAAQIKAIELSSEQNHGNHKDEHIHTVPGGKSQASIQHSASTAPSSPMLHSRQSTRWNKRVARTSNHRPLRALSANKGTPIVIARKQDATRQKLCRSNSTRAGANSGGNELFPRWHGNNNTPASSMRQNLAGAKEIKLPGMSESTPRLEYRTHETMPMTLTQTARLF